MWVGQMIRLLLIVEQTASSLPDLFGQDMNMCIRDIQRAVRRVRARAHEWDLVGLGHWREVDVRYTFVDPMIQALGWDPSDPKECHPEYGRGRGFVDYALFGLPDVRAVGLQKVAPDVIIECKGLYVPLDRNMPKLRGYSSAAPQMQSGVAVLTDGRTWLLYDLSRRGSFSTKLVEQLDLFDDGLRVFARSLDEWIGRERFR